MISVLRHPGTEGVLLIYPETNPRTAELTHLVAVAVSGYEQHEVAQIITADLLESLRQTESWLSGPGTILKNALSRLEPITVQGGVSVNCAVCIRKGQMIQTATCGDFSVLLLRPQRPGFLKGRELQRNEITETTYGLAAHDTMIVVSQPLLDELTRDELAATLKSYETAEAVERIQDRVQSITFQSPQTMILSIFIRDLPAIRLDPKIDGRIDAPVEEQPRHRFPIRKILLPMTAMLAIVVLFIFVRYSGLLHRSDRSDSTVASTQNIDDQHLNPDLSNTIPITTDTTSQEIPASTTKPVEIADDTNDDETREMQIPTGEPGQLQWKVRIGGSNFSSSPIIAGRKLYVGSKDANLYCLSITSGEIIWKFETGGGIGSSPNFAGEYLCFGSYDSTLYCINRHSGALSWKRKVGDRIVSSPKIENGIVYCGSDDHYVYAWRLTDGSPIWKFATEGVVWAQPVIHRDRVFFGSLDGYCYCVDARTGEINWKHPAGGKVYAAAAPVDNKRIIFASAEGSIFMLDIDKGEPLWERNYSGIYSTPLVYDDLIYFGDKDGTFHCLTAEDGNQIWSMATTNAIRSSPVISGSIVYIGGYDGKLYALDRASGEKEWEYDTKSRIYSTPAISRGIVFFGDLTGWLHALNASPG